MVSEVLQAEGQLIDSGRLSEILNRVQHLGGDYQIQRLDVGRRAEDPSLLQFKVSADSPEQLQQIIGDLLRRGCIKPAEEECILKKAEMDGTVPDDFYSTTNHPTEIYYEGRWIAVQKQRMDAAIRCQAGQAECVKLRDVRQGDAIVCGSKGVKVTAYGERSREQLFAFMGSEVSSERQVERQVQNLAHFLRETHARKERIAWVAGPVVVHTGGGVHLSRLIEKGYVDVILSGNALAVHDIEQALFGTSLGVDLQTGQVTEGGHRNHMRAINMIRRAGGIAAAVAQGILKKGVMYSCVRAGVPFVLAGSIRDDGPLHETEMDLIKAQEQYAQALQGVRACLMLSTMLHSIGVGNMLPASVTTICVDINPAVVTKLADRGSAQTYGLVTDVGLFLSLLNQALE